MDPVSVSNSSDSDTDSSELTSYLDKISKLVIQIDLGIATFKLKTDLPNLDYLMAQFKNYLDIIETDIMEHIDGVYPAQYSQYKSRYLRYVKVIGQFREEQLHLTQLDNPEVVVDLSYKRMVPASDDSTKASSGIHKVRKCFKYLIDALLAYRCQLGFFLAVVVIFTILILAMVKVIP